MATAYKSKFTGEQIDNSVETVVSNTATEGQVLTANGSGGAAWQDATGGGTEVVANPSLVGTESDLTGLEVAGTKYKVPSGGGGGGTQLYRHRLSTDNSNITNLVLITTSNNNFAELTEENSDIGVFISGYAGIATLTFSVGFINIIPPITGAYFKFNLYGYGENGYKGYTKVTVTSDTVTPL